MWGIRLLVPCVVLAVRRHPGADEKLMDALTRLLDTRGDALPEALHSYVQLMSENKWSNDVDYEGVIDQLISEIDGTITAANSNAETTIRTQLNGWNLQLQYRATALSDAQSRSTDLAAAVEAEKVAAAEFSDEWSVLEVMNMLTPEYCLLQEGLKSFTATLTAVDEFTCSMDITGDCDGKFDIYKGTQENQTADLEGNLSKHKTEYDEAERQCGVAVDNTKAQQAIVEATYIAWVDKRTDTKNAYDAREAAVCAQECAPQQVGSLNTYLKSTCAAELEKEGHVTDAYSANNTNSLIDRNYEIRTIHIIKCVLGRLEDFSNDSTGKTYDDPELTVEGVLASCDTNDYTELALNWSTTETNLVMCDEATYDNAIKTNLTLSSNSNCPLGIYNGGKLTLPIGKYIEKDTADSTEIDNGMEDLLKGATPSSYDSTWTTVNTVKQFVAIVACQTDQSAACRVLWCEDDTSTTCEAVPTVGCDEAMQSKLCNLEVMENTVPDPSRYKSDGKEDWDFSTDAANPAGTLNGCTAA